MFKFDNRGEMDFKMIVTAAVISAVTIMVGYIVMNGIDQNTSTNMATSALSTSQNVVLQGFGNSTVALAFGICVFILMSIVMVLIGLRGEN
jgi:hypothetical protein